MCCAGRVRALLDSVGFAADSLLRDREGDGGGDSSSSSDVRIELTSVVYATLYAEDEAGADDWEINLEVLADGLILPVVDTLLMRCVIRPSSSFHMQHSVSLTLCARCMCSSALVRLLENLSPHSEQVNRTSPGLNSRRRR